MQIFKQITWRILAFILVSLVSLASIQGDLLFFNPFVDLVDLIGYPPVYGLFATYAVIAFIILNTWLFLMSVAFAIFGSKIDYFIIVLAVILCELVYLPYLNLGLVILALVGVLIGYVLKLVYKKCFPKYN